MNDDNPYSNLPSNLTLRNSKQSLDTDIPQSIIEINPSKKRDSNKSLLHENHIINTKIKSDTSPTKVYVKLPIVDINNTSLDSERLYQSSSLKEELESADKHGSAGSTSQKTLSFAELKNKHPSGTENIPPNIPTIRIHKSQSPVRQLSKSLRIENLEHLQENRDQNSAPQALFTPVWTTETPNLGAGNKKVFFQHDDFTDALSPQTLVKSKNSTKEVSSLSRQEFDLICQNQEASFHRRQQPSGGNPNMENILKLMAPLEIDNHRPRKKSKVSKGFNAVRTFLLRNQQQDPSEASRQKRIKRNSSCYYKLSQFWEKVKQPIVPDSKFRLSWDILLIIVVIFDLILLPMQIAFNLLSNFIYAQYVFDALFIVDIFLSFHTAYYKNGNLVTSHKKIAKRYAKSWLIIDIIVAFPFEVLQENYKDALATSNTDPKQTALGLLRTLRLLKILRALKFLKVNKLFHKIKAYYGASSGVTNTFKLARLLLIVLLMAHWLAGGWYLVAAFEEQNGNAENTWVYQKGFQDLGMVSLYLYSLYWAVATMLTVGYGDITPTTQAETVYTIVAMFLGCAVFAYSLGSINSILQTLETEHEAVSSNVYAVNRFMQKNEIDKDIQTRVRGYMEHLIEEESSKRQYREQFLAFMPENLKKDVLMNLNGKLLTCNHLFAANFDYRFLREVASKIKETTFCPGEIIFSEYGDNDVGDPDSFYILKKGQIELYLQKINLPVRCLEKDNFFGAINFFSGKRETVSARSTKFSQTLSFHRKDFLAILERPAYYKDREAFCCIRDKVNLYKDYSPFFSKCYICNEQNHWIHDCPHGHYIPDPHYIIELANEKNRTFLQSFARKNRSKFNALGHKQEVIQFANQYRVNILDLSFDEKVLDESPLKFRLSDVEEEEEEEESVMGISEFENFSNNVTATRNQILKLQAKHSSHQKKLNSKKIASILNTLKKNLFEDVEEELIFDKVKTFTKYFVHNNVENVIAKINQLNEIKRSEKLNDIRSRKSFANIQTARSPSSLLKNIPSFPKLLSLRRRSIQDGLS